MNILNASFSLECLMLMLRMKGKQILYYPQFSLNAHYHSLLSCHYHPIKILCTGIYDKEVKCQAHDSQSDVSEQPTLRKVQILIQNDKLVTLSHTSVCCLYCLRCAGSLKLLAAITKLYIVKSATNGL